MARGDRSPATELQRICSAPLRSPLRFNRLLKNGVRRPRAAATACGGWSFAPGAFQVRSFLCERTFLRRELQKARHDARIHFSAGC